MILLCQKTLYQDQTGNYVQNAELLFPCWISGVYKRMQVSVWLSLPTLRSTSPSCCCHICMLCYGFKVDRMWKFSNYHPESLSFGGETTLSPSSCLQCIEISWNFNGEMRFRVSRSRPSHLDGGSCVRKTCWQVVGWSRWSKNIVRDGVFGRDRY